MDGGVDYHLHYLSSSPARPPRPVPSLSTRTTHNTPSSLHYHHHVQYFPSPSSPTLHTQVTLSTTNNNTNSTASLPQPYVDSIFVQRCSPHSWPRELFSNTSPHRLHIFLYLFLTTFSFRHISPCLRLMQESFFHGRCNWGNVNTVLLKSHGVSEQK